MLVGPTKDITYSSKLSLSFTHEHTSYTLCICVYPHSKCWKPTFSSYHPDLPFPPKPWTIVSSNIVETSRIDDCNHLSSNVSILNREQLYITTNTLLQAGKHCRCLVQAEKLFCLGHLHIVFSFLVMHNHMLFHGAGVTFQICSFSQSLNLNLKNNTDTAPGESTSVPKLCT